MKILVIGAGAWGTAMAISAATHPDQRSVALWARDAAQAQLMQAERPTAAICPAFAFPMR
jgi:glycerol-3-phosphate dehydrogenase (NAD(P)+)